MARRAETRQEEVRSDLAVGERLRPQHRGGHRAPGFLGYLREAVLGPLAARRVGASPRGVRHLESLAPEEARELQATLCGYDRHDAGRALLASVKLYRQWLDDTHAVIEHRRHAEKLAVQYLDEVIDQAS